MTLSVGSHQQWHKGHTPCCAPTTEHRIDETSGTYKATYFSWSNIQIQAHENENYVQPGVGKLSNQNNFSNYIHNIKAASPQYSNITVRITV